MAVIDLALPNFHYMLICVFCPLLSILLSCYFIKTYRTSANLIIVILSAHSNFEHRLAIRDTWIKAFNSYDNVRYIFVIGKVCTIPLLDRIDYTTCEEWNLTSPDLVYNDEWFCVTSFEKSDKVEETFLGKMPWYMGFGFKVLHSNQLLSVGCHTSIFNSQKDISIILRDAEEIFFSVNISKKTCTFIKNDFCYMHLRGNSLVLPKGFEGELLIDEVNLLPTMFPQFKDCAWSNGSSILFTFGRTEKFFSQFSYNRCSMISAHFQIKDSRSLLAHFELKPQRYGNWKVEQNKIKAKIGEELREYSDILLLDDLIDVYRSLPEKLIKSFDWVDDNFDAKYVLKVDDDTYVNVKKFEEIATRSSSVIEIQDEFPAIWAHFRYHQTVPVFGKWADFDFQSITYPPFPSGAGYLLTGSLLRLLSKNRSNMKFFQGEDITVGIWSEILATESQDGKQLSSVKREVDCWLPSKICNESFLVPQLEPQQMRKVHSEL